MCTDLTDEQVPEWTTKSMAEKKTERMTRQMRTVRTDMSEMTWCRWCEEDYEECSSNKREWEDDDEINDNDDYRFENVKTVEKCIKEEKCDLNDFCLCFESHLHCLKDVLWTIASSNFTDRQVTSYLVR